jgi:hypothetical protein
MSTLMTQMVGLWILAGGLGDQRSGTIGIKKPAHDGL